MTDHRSLKPTIAAQVRLIPLHRNSAEPGRVLESTLTVLGSGDGADFILASSKVDATHAAVVRLGKAAYLADLGAAGGTTLNGRRLRWSRLAKGDEIGVGPFKFGVDIEEADDPAVAEEPVFSIRNEQTIGVITSIDPLLLIGSDPGCDVILRHGSIAPRHCLVVWTAEGPVVRDLHRREKTRLNGRRINFAHLVNGDSIGVGPYELIFTTPIIPSNGKQRPVATAADAYRAKHAELDFDPSILLAGHLPTGDSPIWDALTNLGGVPAAGFADKQVAPHLVLEAEEVSTPAKSRAEADPETTCAAAESESPERPEMQDAPPLKSNGKGGYSMSPNDSGSPDLFDVRDRRLEQRYADLRARVAAAQHALDERARKLREGLNAEREHLKTCRSELQKQAEKLLITARQRQTVDADDSGILDMVTPVAKTNRHPGEADPPRGLRSTPREPEAFRSRACGPAREPTAANADAVNAASPAPPRTPLNLQERARELAELVHIGREDIDRAERRLAVLRQDIQRLRNLVMRTRQRYHERDAELEGRFASLERDQQALREEREALMNRIRALHARELDVQSHMKEAEACREDLAREAERLAKAQEVLDERQRVLRVSVDEERVSLRTRQEELRRKTIELAQATRDRRQVVEEQMAEQKAALERREAEIKARRVAIEQTSREELQKTTTELEEILNIGLGQIDAELEARQVDLEAHVKAMFDEKPGEPNRNDLPSDEGGDHVARRPETVSAARSAEVRGSLDHDRGASGIEAETGSEGRLEVLVREVEALRETLGRLGEQPQYGATIPTEYPESIESGPSGTFDRRFLGGTSVARMREQNAALRGAPSHPESPDGTYRLQTEDDDSDAVTAELTSIAAETTLPPPT